MAEVAAGKKFREEYTIWIEIQERVRDEKEVKVCFLVSTGFPGRQRFVRLSFKRDTIFSTLQDLKFLNVPFVQ